MAIVKSTQATAVDASPRQELSVKESRGRVRTVRFDYTQVGAGGIGDQIELCDLPAGARILAGLSYIRFSASTATATASLGTRAHTNAQTGAAIAENATRFWNASTSIATAGRYILGDANGSQFVDDKDTILGTARVFLTDAVAALANGTRVSGEIAFIVD